MSREEAWLTLKCFVLVASGAALLTSALLVTSAQVRRRWLPLERLRWGHWSGGEVLLAFMGWQFAVVMVMGLLKQVNFFWMIYGREPNDAQVMFWATCLSFPLALALMFSILHLTSQTHPKDVGLTRSRWTVNVALGCVGFVTVTVPIVLLHGFLIWLGSSRDIHGLAKFSGVQSAWWEWLLVLLMTCVAAPVCEEFFFRGVLQGWLRRTNLVGQMAFLATVWVHVLLSARVASDTDDIRWGRVIFAVVLVCGCIGVLQYLKQRKLFLTEADFLLPTLQPPAGNRPQDEADDEDEDDNDVADEPPTPAQREALARWLEQDRHQQRHKIGLAIFGSSLAFALIHPTWPDPMPLFFLGIVLGWLAHRTQSLIPSIVLHSLFNLVPALVLMFSQPSATNGNAATTALRPSVAGSTASSVPASWLPRFK